MKILLIEHNKDDSLLFLNFLQGIEGMAFDLIVADNVNESPVQIAKNNFDIIFLALNSPKPNGIASLELIQLLHPQAPIVTLTKTQNKDLGTESLTAGAQDFLFKEELNSYLLQKTIQYSIDSKDFNRRLIDSESRFKRMFEFSTIGMFRSTASGKLIEVNLAFANIFGYRSTNEAINSVHDVSLQHYVNPSIRHGIVAKLKDQGINDVQMEVEFCRQDKAHFTGLLHMRRSKYISSDEFLLEGYVQDISLQKQTHEDLKDNIKFLKDLMDSVPSPIFSKDKNLTYTGCNKEFEKYIGFSEKEIIGKTILEIRTGKVAEMSHKLDLELLEKKERQVFEHKVHYSTGEERDVIFHKNVIENQNGQVSGIIGIILDITDKKNVLDKLKEELSLNEAMAELSKQLLKPGISVHEISELLLDFAKALTRSEQGYAGTIDPENGDLLLHTFTEMMIGTCKVENKQLRFHKTSEGYPKLWGHALNTKKPFYTNTPQAHAKSNGTPKGHVALKDFLSVPAIINGKLVGQIAVANSEKPFDEKDLEGVKKLTNLYSLAIQKQRSVQELISAKETAEQSDKLKSAFLANMSHEIRTPLNAIVGFAQMLGEEGIDLEETNEFKGVIIKNTDILLRLINDIIEMAMIEAGEIKIHAEERPVYQTLAQINSIWQNSDELINSEGKIKLEFKVPDDHDTHHFKIDDLRFNQIFDNLMMNAFRFTQEGSISLGYYCENDEVIIYVKDTGVGISQEYQKSIFERFRQVDELRVRPFSGTGLGLAITKKLVEHLSGKIRIVSEPGEGSTFLISFPLAANTSQVHAPKSDIFIETPVIKGDIDGKEILIVEDNDSSYEFLEVLLKRKGANLSRATNGIEAVAMAETGLHDIILMDLQLPEMSGFEAITEIRKRRIHLPIIVQTAFSESTERDKAFEAGCDSYLVKPITKNKLEEAIIKFC